ncbi:MAG: 30S ribosomal protein S6 [Maioricimonas sp. JB049]
MFLIDSGRYATDPQGTEAAVREILDRCEAELVAMVPWQEGKLAYPIDGQRKGLHLLTYFRMDGGQIDELARLCRLSEIVLRHLLLQHPPKLFDAMVQAVTQHSEQHAEEAAPEPVAAEK